MLKSILSRVGIGGAKLDARLDQSRLVAGSRLTGRLHVLGGDGSQTATHADIEVKTRVQAEEHLVSVTVAKVRIPGPLVLRDGDAHPFAIDVPAWTPVTTYGGRVAVWLETELEITASVDPTDIDRIDVDPAPEQANVIAAMQSLGFRLAKTDVEARRSWLGGRPFVQEFEFRPANWGGRYDEVEIVFEGVGGGRADLLVQLDRAARGLGGMLREMSGLDESWRRLTIDASSTATAAAELRRLLA
jgi:sporulation-control protein